MMKAPFLCLVLAALPASGEHQETSLAPIALYTNFQHPHQGVHVVSGPLGAPAFLEPSSWCDA